MDSYQMKKADRHFNKHIGKKKSEVNNLCTVSCANHCQIYLRNLNTFHPFDSSPFHTYTGTHLLVNFR